MIVNSTFGSIYPSTIASTGRAGFGGIGPTGSRFSIILTFTDDGTIYALTFDDGGTETVLTL